MDEYHTLDHELFLVVFVLHCKPSLTGIEFKSLFTYFRLIPFILIRFWLVFLCKPLPNGFSPSFPFLNPVFPTFPIAFTTLGTFVIFATGIRLAPVFRVSKSASPQAISVITCFASNSQVSLR